MLRFSRITKKNNFLKMVIIKKLKRHNLVSVLYKPRLMCKQYFQMYLKIRFSMPHCLTAEKRPNVIKTVYTFIDRRVAKPQYQLKLCWIFCIVFWNIFVHKIFLYTLFAQKKHCTWNDRLVFCRCFPILGLL